jgi:hypothetical protein
LLDTFECILLQKAEKLFNSSIVAGGGFAKKSTFPGTGPECSFSTASGQTDTDAPSSMRFPSIETLSWAADLSWSNFAETTTSASLGPFFTDSRGLPIRTSRRVYELGFRPRIFPHTRKDLLGGFDLH